MDIKHEDANGNGEFFIEEGGARLAKLQYSHSGEGEIHVYHTEVDDRFSGKGVGRKLVSAAAEYVRKESLKIHATCTYAHKILSETPEFSDLLI